LEFTSNKAILDVIERIVTPLGRRIDESSPMVDARLKDGSRVNVIIPPLAIKGPTITIRKFPEKRILIEDLVGYFSLDDDMATFLKLCVATKKLPCHHQD
jgi:pilus assembly protein CpaF